MITENVSTLTIHKMSHEQYEREYKAGTIDPNAIYLTPDPTDEVNLAEVIEKHNTSETAHTDIREAIDTKVDKVEGKGLSTEDYTTAEKEKLAGIAEGANNYSHPETHSVDMITGLADVATSGSYNDLSNKPTIPGALADLTDDAAHRTVSDTEKSTWNAKSDFSGSYTDLTNVPTEFNPSTHTHDYIPTSQKGAASGVAELDASGKVPSAQLPSYVDDVVEYSAKASFPTTGETGKIYIDTTTNITYRWGGSTYVPIGSDLALGETSSTAYYGDKGKVAYDHSQITSGNPHGLKYDDLLNKPSIPTTASNVKAVSYETQTLTDTQKAQARSNIGAGTSSFSGSYNDLSNKPTIPTVNNATLTIQKNGTTVNTFTANASSNVTANITVPTKVSELTNDSGYITAENMPDVDVSGVINEHNTKINSLEERLAQLEAKLAAITTENWMSTLEDGTKILKKVCVTESKEIGRYKLWIDEGETIVDYEFMYDEGMTWGDWVNSDYNTSGYYIDSGLNVIRPSGDDISAVCDPDIDFVTPSDEIIGGIIYYLDACI